MNAVGDAVFETEKCSSSEQLNGEQQSTSKFEVFLDHVGEVLLSIDSSGLSWKLADCKCNGLPSFLERKLAAKADVELNFSDIYAVELAELGLIHPSVLQSTRHCFMDHGSEMYRFAVHCIQRSTTHLNIWLSCMYMFGHKDLRICELLVNQINASLNKETGRPKNLLVFIHPLSGNKNGRKIWDTVTPIFSRAKVRTKVTVTERAGHAFDVVASMTNQELNSYDGIVAVGGDGFFNEILNGLLSSRLQAPYPPVPPNFVSSNASVSDQNQRAEGIFNQNEDRTSLLPVSRQDGSGIPASRLPSCFSAREKEDVEFRIPNKWFRLGLIPAGSTDAIVICTTGARDPITSALQIVLGKRVCLDIAQVVQWKATAMSQDEPSVRYTASFVGYGFYGDVIVESEKIRWMGPKRYDVAGTKVFLRHRSYEAEVAYLDVESEKANPSTENDHSNEYCDKKHERLICRANCKICCKPSVINDTECQPITHFSTMRHPRWLKSRGRYLSVGAAIISCRNGRAPDGLVADAHLSDGFFHLILIKDCPHALYLWHLTQLARKNGKPLDFEFVEHHKTPAFAFTSFGKEGVWNLDGEILRAHKLSAQVFRGLVSLFAAGPSV